MFYNRQTLCTTLGGNDCPLVTISSMGSPRELLENSLEGIIVPRFFLLLSKSLGVRLEDHGYQCVLQSHSLGKGKKYILLSARVHPGESNASWVMRGWYF